MRCGLAGNQLLSSLVSPSHFAGVQLIVKEITGLGHCSPGVTLDTQAYTANVRIAPQPRLSMSATGATVCSSETSATVKFNYSSSENMAQLSASQLTVQAKTAAGAIAPGIVCTTGEPHAYLLVMLYSGQLKTRRHVRLGAWHSLAQPHAEFLHYICHGTHFHGANAWEATSIVCLEEYQTSPTHFSNFSCVAQSLTGGFAGIPLV